LDRDAARLGVGAHPAQTVLLLHAHEPRRASGPHGPAAAAGPHRGRHSVRRERGCCAVRRKRRDRRDARAHAGRVSIVIRTERGADAAEVAAIGALEADAFGSEGYRALSAALRATDHHRPAWSLVAVDRGRVVGHVMVGTVHLEPEDRSITRLVPALSPLAVAPERQRRGLGRALVEAAVAAVDADGEPFVVLEGSPAYYGRLGFEPAAAHGIRL